LAYCRFQCGVYKIPESTQNVLQTEVCEITRRESKIMDQRIGKYMIYRWGLTEVGVRVVYKSSKGYFYVIKDGLKWEVYPSTLKKNRWQLIEVIQEY